MSSRGAVGAFQPPRWMTGFSAYVDSFPPPLILDLYECKHGEAGEAGASVEFCPPQRGGGLKAAKSRKNSILDPNVVSFRGLSPPRL